MTIPLPSDQDATGRSFGPEELALVAQVLESGTLTATKGVQTKSLESEFVAMLGVRHVIACSSGSAAVHVAIAALDLEPGDEVITTSVTDMGALTPILYQGAIPVFADVDRLTGNVTAATIADRLSSRTRAIVATHLFGNPCAMDEIMALASARGIPVIEDSAQAFLASHRGQLTGTMGDIGCFSLQQGKHITTGEGGLVTTNDDAYARRARVFVNKAWPYGEANPDHEFLALNYRITELQSAVARGQLGKLQANVDARISTANRFISAIAGTPGVGTPVVADGDVCSFWRVALRVDSSVIPGGPGGLATALRAFDIPSAPRYIVKPAFRCKVIAEQRTFGNSRWPFTLARPEAVDYSEALFPGTFAMLDEVLVLSWNEKVDDAIVDQLAAGVRSAAAQAEAA